MTALKSLMGRTGVVCDITHLWPYPTIESQCPDIKTLFLASLLKRAFFCLKTSKYKYFYYTEDQFCIFYHIIIK